MLRIAVQSKGRLFDDTMNLLSEADIKVSASKRTLLVQSSNFPLEVLYLRDDDIPQSVASGVADIGVVGENEFVDNSSKYVIEIMPKDIDKGYGLSVVAESLGIDRKETVAIGDSMNDLAMVEWAGVGVAVSNADDRLKSAADIVTKEPMSLGVLEIADRLF